MATRCYVPFKVPKVRLTLLDSCGTPVTGAGSVIASDGVITVEQTATLEDREEFYVKNADGLFCVQETNPPITKWIQLTVTMCNVDPMMVNFVTGETIITDDATSPTSIGNDWRSNDSSLVNFGFEAWTRVTGTTTCTTPLFGYALYPWMVEGTMGDVTYQNGAATFQWIARTKLGGNWGAGPYAVQQSAASATLGNPTPLTPAITSDVHRRMITTFEPPPIATCGAIALTNPALVMVQGTSLQGSVTLPTTPYTGVAVTPGTIDWGDSSTTSIAAGATSPQTHTYAMAGTYTATYRSKAFSAAPWISAAVPIS